MDEWHDSAAVDYSVDHYVSEGQHEVLIEYYDDTGDAEISMSCKGIVYRGHRSPAYRYSVVEMPPGWSGDFTDDVGIAEDGEGSGEKKKTKDYEIYISKPSKSVTANHPTVNTLAVLATHPERENLRSESVDMLLDSLGCHIVDVPEPTLWTMRVLIPALRQRLMPRFRETLPRKVRALRNRIERARNGGDDRALYETLKQLRALALFCEEHRIPLPS